MRALRSVKIVVPPLSCCAFSSHRTATVDQLLSQNGFACVAPLTVRTVRRMRLVPAHLCLCVNARAETVSCRPTVAWWITYATLFYAIRLIHSPRQREIFGDGASPMENSFCAKRNFMDSYGYWIYMWNVIICMHACIWYFFIFCHAREFMPRNEFTRTIKKHCHQNRKKKQNQNISVPVTTISVPPISLLIDTERQRYANTRTIS